MMRSSRLQSHVQLLALPKLLGVLSGGGSGLAASACPTAAVTAAAATVHAHLRGYAAKVKPQDESGGAGSAVQLSSEAAQAAHELGLDAVPFEQLKAILDPALNPPARGEPLVPRPLPPKQRQLTYPDLPGYQQAVNALVSSPETYKDHLTAAPVLDVSQWVEAHFKEAGYTMEPRGPFYVWRAWAAAHLPQDQYMTLLYVHEVMSDESSRSAFVKQAQHELARLWDWQQRRAALGLSPDLPHSPTAAAAGSSSSSSAASILHSPALATTHPAAAAAREQQELAETAAAAMAAAAVSDAAAAGARGEAAAAAAAESASSSDSDWRVGSSAEGVPPHLAASVPGDSSSSSSSDSDADVGISSGVEGDAAALAGLEDLSNKSLFDVLESSGALEPEQPPAAAQETEGAAAAATAADEDFDNLLVSSGSSGSSADAAAAVRAVWQQSAPSVVDGKQQQGTEDWQRAAMVRRRLSSPAERKTALDDVRHKLERGEYTKRRGKFIRDTGVTLRVHRPVVSDGDIFLPTTPVGNPNVSAALLDPDQTKPVNPDRVTAQAKWVVRQADKAAKADSRSAGVPGLSPGQGSGARLEDLATWTSMPLLDRAVLHEESLRQAVEKLAAKPKAAKRWQLLEDGYSFDLQQRPPTQAFDLLTTYLEVKYADVLLQKDAAQSMSRQLALHSLQASSGLASELLEQPPAALTAAKTLSPAEREAVSKTLDDLLGSKQFGQYREAVLQLYCDGLVSWDELQQCWAAAQAGEELTAAAEAPVSIADDRQQLYQVLSGQQQLDLNSSSSSSGDSSRGSDVAAARKAWEAAGKKLQVSWSAAASDSSSSGSSKGPGESISYEEAEQTWQQLLHLAGQPDGPRFDQVLLAGGSGSSSDSLQQQLQQLQRALQRACGLDEAHIQELTGLGSSSSSSGGGGVGLGDLQQLRDVFAAPPSLQQVLQQRWQQVADQELGQQQLSGSNPGWPQMWQLLEQVVDYQQRQAPQLDGSAAADDAAQQLQRYLREADGVPLTPPPYPGARRLLRWEQRLMLHAASGQVVMPAELKVKLAVAAAELQEETGLSDQALQYLLAVAGDRYNPSTGDLTIACDRYPTREENRRWCLEVLHRLLQAAQGKHPSNTFWVDSSTVGVPAGNPAAQA